jgi:hypothetical protein
MVSAAQFFYRAGKLQKCTYCSRKLHVTTARNDQRATRDHVHPRHLGGTKCVWACVACNQLKGGMTLEAWQAFMQKNPRWWVGFRPTGKRRDPPAPKTKKKRLLSAKAKSGTGKAAAPKQPPTLAQADVPPSPQGAGAGPVKRGRPKLWIRHKAPRPPHQPEPAPAQVDAQPPPDGAAAGAPKRGRRKLWIRRKAPPPPPKPEPQPAPMEAKPAPIETKPAPKPAKRKRIWIRRKARASMAAEERSEA